jgi:hypothetical protein
MAKKSRVGCGPCGSWADVAQLVEQSIRNGRFLSRNSAVFQRARLTTLPRDRATLLFAPWIRRAPASWSIPSSTIA